MAYNAGRVTAVNPFEVDKLSERSTDNGGFT
ncbi:hypothetical protein M2164_008260 [Streptomyces sp. SAI-208]|nr:hypothetical protein [Streptomyces sp. SAI-208]